jgi:PKD repeat protein
VTTRSWEFPGGSPAASSAANPQVTYNTPGVYAVTLTAGNAQGSDTHSKTEYIRVLPATAEVQSYYLQEDFESADEQFFTLSDFGNRWERTNVGYTGDHSIFINNHSGNPAGSVDEFVLPSVDMRNINNPRLFFKLAYRTKSGQSDQLRVFISTNCGQTWSMRYNRSGSNLSSVSGNQGSPFTPSGQEQWKEEEVNLSNFASAEHMLVKFQSRSDEGNNIYVDDIRISGPLSIGDRAINAPDLTLAPNPATDFAELRMTTFTAEPTSIAVMDIMGREVASLHKGSLAPGDHNFRVDVSALGASGVYLVVVQTSSHREVRRLLVGK